MKNIFFLTIFISLSSLLLAQQPVRRLPSIINHPSLNLFAPYMSADGNAIVFMSDNGQDGEYVISYTSRELDWNTPSELPKQLSNRLNFTMGYALSADGKKIYVTSAKSPVIGGYDIFVSALKDGVWTNPENLMMPINSKGNEACPSFTPDGNTIYFMRCDKMNSAKAEACKIFTSSKKPNGQWAEPVELPEFINTGNSQTPRILADMETLIFSSDKMKGNKGGMDLYLTRLAGGQWSDPVPLDFVNSERDDQYVSVNALGRYILKESKGARNNWELTEFLIPQHLKPKSLMKIEGTVKGKNGAPIPAYISITDRLSGKRIYSARPKADGTYFLYLTEGSIYELSFDPEHSGTSFLMKVVDLTGDKIMQKEKLDVTLVQPEPGDTISLEFLQFKPFKSELEPQSYQELRKLTRLIRGNPNLGFEIQVTLQGYRETFEPGDPELSETLEISDTLQLVDSAGMLTDSLVVYHRVLYHNDRTMKQAQAVMDYLIGEGVKPEQLTFMVNARQTDVIEPKTTMKAKVFKLR